MYKTQAEPRDKDMPQIFDPNYFPIPRWNHSNLWHASCSPPYQWLSRGRGTARDSGLARNVEDIEAYLLVVSGIVDFVEFWAGAEFVPIASQ